MKGLNVLILLAGGAALYFWNLARAASNLVYFPGNVTGFSLDGFSPVMFLDLLVQNTNNVSFTINSLSGSVFCDGVLIGNISNFQPVVISGNSQGTVPVKILLQPITLVNEIIRILSGGSGQKDIRLDGAVNANGIQANFAITYKIGV